MPLIYEIGVLWSLFNQQLSIFKELLNAGRLYNNDPFLLNMARAALDGEGKLYAQKCLPLEGK
jgi:hypothetical protein